MARRYVIQEHTRGGETHWDLMLESGGVLKTWRLNIAPDQIGSEPVMAEQIFDHDRKFLTYEGPVNKGAGSVRIADTGTFETLEESENKIRLRLNSKILFGEFVLEKIENDKWRFFKAAQ